jgi:hypothetical protein
MPTLEEMDDMLEQIARIHMSLQHLRDIVSDLLPSQCVAVRVQMLGLEWSAWGALRDGVDGSCTMKWSSEPPADDNEAETRARYPRIPDTLV